MTPLVERLREVAERPRELIGALILREAASTITQLEARQGELVELLEEQHAAMADVMMLRRLSSRPEQREMAERAIVLWQKVKAFLARAALAAPSPAPVREAREWAERIADQFGVEGQSVVDAIEEGFVRGRMVQTDEPVRKALEPFARIAQTWSFSVGPDGIDDELTVIAKTVARPEYEVKLSTGDFQRAKTALARLSSIQSVREGET